MELSPCLACDELGFCGGWPTLFSASLLLHLTLCTLEGDADRQHS